MAVKQPSSVAHIKTDPLRNFKFLVNIRPAGRKALSGFATMGFMSVSGLNVTTEVIPYRQGGMNTTTQKMPGQAQPLDAKVRTPNGYKLMGDVEVGDLLLDPFGESSKVEYVVPQGIRPVYRVRLADGSVTRACNEHLWAVQIEDRTNGYAVLSTVEIRDRVEGGQRVYVPELHDSLGLTQRSREDRCIVAVEFTGREVVQCIRVSAESHLYVTDDDIPTHNSDFAPITLSKGLAVGDDEMWNWMQELFAVIQGTGTGQPGNEFRHTVDVKVLDHPVTKGPIPIKAWFKIYNAWPTALAFSDLDAGANAVIIQQMTLAHEGFEFKLASSIGTNEVSFT